MTSPAEPLAFTDYRPSHAEHLRTLTASEDWQALLSRKDALRRCRQDVRIPPPAPGQQAAANRYLIQRNGERVRRLIEKGVRDEETLLEALGDWPAALEGDDRFPIVFLGLVTTLDCTFAPRCMYCNQTWLPRRLTVDDWKGLLDEAAEPIPPYVYLTGGEPLLTASEIWGEDGLVAHATDLGCAVNVNTNAVLITPHVALQLVRVGLSKLHVSIDAVDADIQGQLFQGSERFPAVLRGIHAIQIAREVLGTCHPEIHVNCVLTARNMFQFPELLRFLLETRRAPPREPGASAFDDLAFHLIPVGGEENIFLRPTTSEWKRFHGETWPGAERIWREHEEATGVAESERRPLHEQVPFANPFLRARHELTLDEYCDQAARGEYWQGALTDRCYVSPTQAFVLPDGSQHWCGAHAIRRPSPLGDVRERGLRENIRAGMSRWEEVPDERCTGCAGATCVINQAAARNLRKQIADWLA